VKCVKYKTAQAQHKDLELKPIFVINGPFVINSSCTLRIKSKFSTRKKLLIIKQYSNQSGLTEYNSGVRLPIPT
jgi:hypothetical protein